MLKSGRGRRSFLGGRGLQSASAGLATITHVGTTFGGNDILAPGFFYPSGILQNDLILAWSWSPSNIVNIPSGFTLINSANDSNLSYSRVGYKIADGTESGTPANFSQSQLQDCAVMISVYRNVNVLGTFINSNVIAASGVASTSLALPDISTLSAKRYIVTGASNTASPPSTVTGDNGEYSLLSSSGRIGDAYPACVYIKEFLTGIANESINYTYPSSQNRLGGFAIALVPKSL